jgi:hypothetical protein
MMADTYKILAQDTAESIEENSGENQANILYTVPSNTQAAISSISLINTAEENVEYSLGVVKAEDINSSVGEVSYFAYSNLYIAVNGSSGAGAISTDGASWTETVLSLSAFIGIAYGDGKFVAISYQSPLVAYSTDGITWTSHFIGINEATAIAYGNGRFVVVGRGGSGAYSTNGISWSSHMIPYTDWNAIAYGSGVFVISSLSMSGLAWSTDGVSWTFTTAQSPLNWETVTYGNGKFVVLSRQSSAIAYSTNGFAWSISYLPDISPSYWASVASGNGRFVVISNGFYVGLNSVAVISTNGVDWSQQNNLPVAGMDRIIYGNGKFIALGTVSAATASSTDGLTWTQGSDLPAASYWSSIAYGSPLQQFQTVIELLSNTQTIIPTRSIEPNAVDEIVGGITLSEGDQIRIHSESPDLIAQVYGVEIA